MSKIKKIFISLILFIVLAGASVYLHKNNLKGYAVVFIALASISLIVLVFSVIKKQDERSKYEYELKQIIKKYNSILAETTTLPDLSDKNIMLLTNIEDMIDASIEIRKPIYYRKESDYCSFSLLDNNDICVYILKLNKEEDTPIEPFIKNRKQNIEDLIELAKDNRDIDDIVNSKDKKKKLKKQKIEEEEEVM